MNDKKCKRLRREAEAATVGQVERELGTDRRTGSAMNAPHSTRGVYRLLKRMARA